MSALTLAADVLAALGHACTLILAIAVIGTALIILAEVFTDAGRRIDAAPIPTGTRGADRYGYPADWATYGDECPDCGKDDCACEWRDLMAADQEAIAASEGYDWDAAEKDVTR